MEAARARGIRSGSSAVALLLLATLGVAACGGDSKHNPPGGAGPVAGDLASDDRIAFLLVPCPKAEPFLADTGDLVGVLVSKLEKSQLDPLRRAKEDLVQMGEVALPELRRFCQRKFSDPLGAMAYLNAIAVVSAMDTKGGHDLLIAGLAYSQDNVRLQALQGLASQSLPADYERLMALASIASPDVLHAIGPALANADRARYEEDFVAWLAARDANGELWSGAAERIRDTTRPEILAKIRELVPRTEGETRAYLHAALAHAGDAEALEALRTDLTDENVTTRTYAVRALQGVGMTNETARLLWEDRDETLRGMVATAIAALPPTQETTAWLQRGLLDRAPTVRQACFSVLARRGDPEARESGLAMLEGSRGEFEQALAGLREAWAEDKAFAERSLELLKRMRAGETRPVGVDDTSIDRAIAQLPLVEATEILYESAKKVSRQISGLPAHRWYTMQAGNTGPAGRAWLRERWAEESDPAWRVDIAAACASDRDDAGREFLLRIVDDPVATPLEILHAANLLVHQGPGSLVAPRLKRVALRIADPRVRPALNCLLWQWYGEG